MLLIVTNQRDEHADAVIARLKERNVAFLRFNTESYPQRIRCDVGYAAGAVSGRLRLPAGELSLDDVTVVWYRRPNDPVADPRITNEHYAQFAREQSLEFLRGLWSLLEDRLWVN